MQTSLDRRDALETEADVVVVASLERGSEERTFPKDLVPLDQAAGGILQAAWARKEIRGKRGEVHQFHFAGGSRRIAWVGLGHPNEFGPDMVRQAGAYLARSLQGKGAKVAGVQLRTLACRRLDLADALRAFSEGVQLAAYEFAQFKAEPSPPPLEQLLFCTGRDGAGSLRALKTVLERTQVLVQAQLWARDIGNQPANIASPEYLAQQAVEMGRSHGLKVTVFDEKQLQEMGCGGILAVGGGSTAHPPRLVILEYPGRPMKGSRTVAVVGKGITFDSGGISIKPAANMGDMKFDKSGAVAVLGILKAVSELKVPHRVIGAMACAENVPSGTSYRPGDIVRTYSGKTIEVLNTDAEGRVVLSDALAYVKAQFHPDEIIDLATLTGACVVALGVDMAGLISTDDKLARGLLRASEETGEKIWRLPLTSTHREMVKSRYADVRNSTEMPPAGTLTAAAFLNTFVGDTPWAHLDIAGPAYVHGVGSAYAPPYHPQGYAGFGIRLVTSYIMNGHS
jgi:leucyl aminopeptidase